MASLPWLHSKNMESYACACVSEQVSERACVHA